MSLVDPSQRWWRRAGVWRAAAWTLWVIAAVVSAVAGWANAQYLGGAVWVDWFGGSEILSAVEGVPEPVVRLAEATVVALPFMLFAAGVADVIAGIVRDTGPAWALPRVVGIAAGAGGAGWLIASLTAPVSEPPLMGMVLLVAGIALLVIEPISQRVSARRRAESQRVRAQGVRAVGTVTKVDVTDVGGVNHWLVTVSFPDREGRTRWVRYRVRFGTLKIPKVGNRVSVAYDPAHPGRRSSIVVLTSTLR